MTQAIQLIPRSKIDSSAWDACVQASSQQIVYGYSWYLDAVLPAPNWQWVGLVQSDNSGQYRVVMPVPLRRKGVVGIYQKWVVHQPFFCQFFSVFSQDETVDRQDFLNILIDLFRYSSVYTVHIPHLPFNQSVYCQTQSTQVLDLKTGYRLLYRNYTRDRKVNLQRAKRADWTIVDSTNIEPLLTLFREHHALTIEDGVADWAYPTFRKLFEELSKRGLGVLRYAVRDNRIEAGALFVCEGNRIVYLFNAASPVGRIGNARTLLIDQIIQEKAGRPILFDFESPAKRSVRDFYASFGAVEEPFYALRWNRLNLVERTVLQMKRRLYK